VDVYVVSDKLEPLAGQIRTRLLDFSGAVLVDKTQDVRVPAQSSAVYLTLEKKELLANADPRKTFLVFDLEVAGQKVSHNLLFFDTMHNIDFPTAHVDASLESSGDGYSVTLRSPTLARSVYVSFGDLDVRTSDNYFDLLPREAVTIELKTSTSLDQLKQSIQVLSLTDAFPAAETMH
jgi:beta-mannosidase